MIRFTLLSLLLLAATDFASAQTITATIQSGGLSREYRLYKPPVYNGAKPVPLLLNLHGYTSNNLEQEYYASFKAIADTANFLIVLPNGTIDNQGNRFWNTFGGNYPVDDVAFIDDLLDTLQANYNIDPQRIYSTGMSNGGFMSYALASKLNNRIAAIASVCGSMTVADRNALQVNRPVPVMEIHGNADAIVPYPGGTLLNFSPIPELLDAWVNINHCNLTPVITPVPNTNLVDGCTAEKWVYSGGDKGSTVVHYKIEGGGHTWPGSIFITGVTNQDFNASYEIWRFLNPYRLDKLSETTSPDASTLPCQIYPNPATEGVSVQLAEPTSEKGAFECYYMDGRLKVQKALSPGISTTEMDVKDWNPGVYVLKIQVGKRIRVERIVVGSE